jgi:hypothetical protein
VAGIVILHCVWLRDVIEATVAELDGTTEAPCKTSRIVVRGQNATAAS